MKLRPLLLSFFLLLTGTVSAQQLKGTVVDAGSGKPLAFVPVGWMGTDVGTLTDTEGGFVLSIHPKVHILVTQSMGYVSDTLVVHSLTDTVVEIRLHHSGVQLKRVKVRSRRRATFSKMNSIEQTEVITTEGLRGLACCNLGESFENSATVDVGYSDAVSGSKQIQLLGLTGVYSQMLLENVPFLKGLSAPFGLGYVPGQWMESISVSKGVATVKNGYEAITGTINLEYEKPHKGDRFSLNLYENSDLKSEITAKLNHRFNEHLATGLLVYGTYNAQRTDHIGHDGFADYPLQQQLNVVNRWHYENGKGFVSQSLVNYIHGYRLGGDMRFDGSMRGSDSIYGFGGTTDRLHFFTKNGFRLSNTASFGSQVAATWFRQDAYYGMSDYRGEEKNLYVNLLVNAEVAGGHTVDYGVSFRYSDVDERLGYFPYIGAVTQNWFGDGDNFDYREILAGLFGQFTFLYGDRFNATLGLRYDYSVPPEERQQVMFAHYAGSDFRSHALTPRLHFRWNVWHDWILRGSIGRGFRTPNLIAENFGILASGRRIVLNEWIAREEAWNGGLNISKRFKVGDDREASLTVDFYRTSFVSQAVLDLDVAADEAHIYNLDGQSYSNVLQADFSIEPLDGFSLSLAGKLNDVWCTYHNQLMRKPYTSFWKGLLVLSYHTRFDKWRFDLTTQLNGPQRLPLNKGSFQGETDAYIYMLGQVTRKFKRFELYAGIENITGYVQPHPVIGYDAPFSSAFDASIVYAPLMGRLYYIGLRFNVM